MITQHYQKQESSPVYCRRWVHQWNYCTLEQGLPLRCFPFLHYTTKWDTCTCNYISACTYFDNSQPLLAESVSHSLLPLNNWKRISNTTGLLFGLDHLVLWSPQLNSFKMLAMYIHNYICSYSSKVTSYVASYVAKQSYYTFYTEFQNSQSWIIT